MENISENPYAEYMTQYEMRADAKGEHLYNEIVRSRKAHGKNSMRYWLDDGREILRYMNTDLVTIWPEGGIELSTGGFWTPTTAVKMNAELERLSELLKVELPHLFYAPKKAQAFLGGHAWAAVTTRWVQQALIDEMVIYPDGLVQLPDGHILLFGAPSVMLTEEELVQLDVLLGLHPSHPDWHGPEE